MLGTLFLNRFLFDKSSSMERVADIIITLKGKILGLFNVILALIWTILDNKPSSRSELIFLS